MVSMEPHFNIWFEIDGEVVASLWRMRLLVAIHEHGSITEGAKAMGVPYRVAWQKVHEMEERLGAPPGDADWGSRRRRPPHRGGPGARRPHAGLLRPYRQAVREIYLDTFGPPES